jgi:hypothetical protein
LLDGFREEKAITVGNGQEMYFTKVFELGKFGEERGKVGDLAGE